MSRINFAFGYLKYYLTAQNKHHIQAPFLYKLVTEVFNKDKSNSGFNKIEEIRSTLLNNHRTIEVEDFGAGSVLDAAKQKRISEIAKASSKPSKYCRFLYRLIKYLQPSTMIEIGTSLGISTMYQSMGNPEGKLFTIEGSKEIAAQAKQNFEKAGIENIELITGNFDEQLPLLLQQLHSVDYVFFDGNHRLVPTLNYFDWCLKKVNADSVFIFDDINWSDEMKTVWKKISSHPKVTISIDLYMMGIVFFNPDFSKEHFTIRF